MREDVACHRTNYRAILQATRQPPAERNVSTQPIPRLAPIDKHQQSRIAEAHQFLPGTKTGPTGAEPADRLEVIVRRAQLIHYAAALKASLLFLLPPDSFPFFQPVSNEDASVNFFSRSCAWRTV